MPNKIPEVSPQLHPLQRAMKVSWNKLVAIREVKQLYLATRCKVDESRVSRWLNPATPDFPPTRQLADFVEALQEWPGIQPWEPLEAFNVYFGCHVAPLHRAAEPILQLAALAAGASGRLFQQLLQALSPDSEGGVDVTDAERATMLPTIAALRRLADDLDDVIEGKPEAPEAREEAV